MRTGLTKRQKTTEIFFDETKSRITVYTHNTDLKKRLTAYAERYPDHCTMTDEDSETGYKAFEIEKGRLSFRLTFLQNLYKYTQLTVPILSKGQILNTTLPMISSSGTRPTAALRLSREFILLSPITK